MRGNSGFTPRPFRAYQARDIDKIPQLQNLSHEELTSLKAVSAVLPFRVNNYVIEELIDWQNIPNDPIYQLTIPQPEMLQTDDLHRLSGLIRDQAPRHELQAEARLIQMRMNPHPAGQMELNVPNRMPSNMQ